jgi:NAD(P)-dependent dehydrogenase (short-subunit alcohol dehydrogenase family)
MILASLTCTSLWTTTARRERCEAGTQVVVFAALIKDTRSCAAREPSSQAWRSHHGQETDSADQADPKQAEELIKTVHVHFGRLDILVNNAAIFAIGPVDNPGNDLAVFERQQTINFTSVVAAIRAAAMVMEKGGRIISIGSALVTSRRAASRSTWCSQVL